MGLINVAVVGSTGYVGIELVKLLLSHPYVVIKYLCASSQSVGLRFSDLCCNVSSDIVISSFDQLKFEQLDVVFLCLPHNHSHDLVSLIPSNVKIIDLSADFRIRDPNVYKQWYGQHNSSHLVKNFTYGLSEIYREDIKSSGFVACPGCYATSVLIPLIPLIKLNLIKNDLIVVDSKSGVSGAGKILKINNIFCEVNESIKAYDICQHRHIPEIEQELCAAFNMNSISVQFSPNLIPINRGMLSNIYVYLQLGISVDDIKNTLMQFYEESMFVFIDNNKALTTNSVVGTNNCYIGIFSGRNKEMMVITSVIDNLLKGAAGQALQNFNLMFDFPEGTGMLK